MRKRLAALWLVLVAIMSGVLVTQMRHGLPLSTDLLALLPQEERDPVLKTANEAISRALGRHVIVLVGHPERAKARAVAQTMADALAATNLVDTIGSQATASQFRQIGATYFPHRHGLLGAEDRELLETGRAREIAGRALAQTYGIGFADGDLLRNDPFLLFPRFLMGLPAMASRLTMDNGMLSVTEGGITWVGIIGTLRQEPYRLDVQSALVGAVDRVEQTAVAEDSRVRILRTGTVFFAEAGSRTAMQEASNLSTLSIIGTVLLILVVFRRVGPLAQNIVTILVGTIVGVSATILIFGEIHAIALLFGTSLIGTSVDYGLFYCATALDPKRGPPAQRLRTDSAGGHARPCHHPRRLCVLGPRTLSGLETDRRSVGDRAFLGLSDHGGVASVDGPATPGHGRGGTMAGLRRWLLRDLGGGSLAPCPPGCGGAGPGWRGPWRVPP